MRLLLAARRQGDPPELNEDRLPEWRPTHFGLNLPDAELAWPVLGLLLA